MPDIELNVEYVSTDKILPYVYNARKHGDEDTDAIMASIKEFGFNDPIGVWHDIIVEGHGRLIAAKRLGMETVPIIRLDHLTDDQRKAYALAHNRTAELSEWDFNVLNAELADISNIDMSEFKFDEIERWFDRKEKDGDRHEDGNEEYNDFVDKFKGKKTTDDCYTPENIYEAIAEWAAEEYGINRKNFIRPFYPGGDYKTFKYKKNDVVVDNPPFSILAEIVKWYGEHGIPFFLFAPTLTLFSSSSSSSSSSSCAIPVGAPVVYENGASVNTSFLTSLEGKETRVRTAPELYRRIKEENDRNLDEMSRNLPKYSYPDEIITAPMVARWSKYGIDYRLSVSESEKIGALDKQREAGKSIFGNGYITSEKAAAEKAAAIFWELSEREKAIVRKLSGKE